MDRSDDDIIHLSLLGEQVPMGGELGEGHTDKEDTNSLTLVFTGLEFMLWSMMRNGLGLCDETLTKACLAKKKRGGGSCKGTGAHSQLKKIQASLSQTQPLPRGEPR